ncbi:SpoIIIAH-like family protein [Priestia taiwanensis]|uniref:Stage III sporulation protein AH n=1 Tax=Priestia taiwanensis TaxID=1347902 RepID=A0A917AHT4_9BACI|nr:SpoIIIAH-like family protein [Priestia taiwanensis]MBM7361396.1 stage III sporulation protein AH [Priestia taiwanensis]GGE53836.1 stage III sporulation protein AH [Priestia taiwanensis]
MLRKQTIWLLTMLSLVIVLSVYYVTQPDVAPTTKQVDNKNGDKATDAGNGDADVETTDNEGFVAKRLELEQDRSRLKENLETAAGDTKVSAEDRSKAKDKIDELDRMGQKEQKLEIDIKAAEGYKDVLVHADGAKVKVTVVAEKLTAEQVNKIMQLTKKELGVSAQHVTVSHVTK